MHPVSLRCEHRRGCALRRPPSGRPRMAGRSSPTIAPRGRRPPGARYAGSAADVAAERGGRCGTAAASRPWRPWTSPTAGENCPRRAKARLERPGLGRGRHGVGVERPGAVPHGALRTGRPPWIARDRTPTTRECPCRRARTRELDASDYMIAPAADRPRTSAGRSRSAARCGGRRCTRPRAGCSSSSSTAPASATRC